MRRAPLSVRVAAGLLVSLLIAFLAAEYFRGRGDSSGTTQSVRPERSAVENADHVAPVASEPEPVAETAVATNPVEQFGWQQRFPTAVEIERIETPLRGGERLVEAMLKTDDEHQPLVYWQERQEHSEAGGWVTVHYSAFSGDRFLMGYDEGDATAESALATLLQNENAFLKRRSKFSPLYVIGVRDPTIAVLKNAVAEGRILLGSERVDFNNLHFSAAVPNDWKPDFEWALEKVAATSAWDYATGSSEVVVAILDTGVKYDHADLADNIFTNPNPTKDDVHGYDFYSDDADPSDTAGHGTHVAGIAAARGGNEIGTVGVSWSVKILPLRVGSASSLDTSAIIEALDYIRTLNGQGANIVVSNNSYGSGSFNTLFRKAIQEQQDAGILFVAAAGNDGTNIDGGSPEYPAAYTMDNIITVANSNQEDVLTTSSNWGATSVDLSAPGEAVYSTYSNGGYTNLSGTSMAAPMVAGAVALLASAEPDLTPSQIKQRILDTVDPVADQAGLSVTGGRLNLLQMLKPEQQGRFLQVTNIPESILILPEYDVPVDFVVASDGSAAVTASVVDQPAGATIESVGNATYRLSVSELGNYTVRFQAKLDQTTLTVDRQIVAGEPDDVLAGLRRRFDFAGNTVNEPDLAGGADGSFVNATRVENEYGRSVKFGPSADSRMNFVGEFSSQVTIAALVKGEGLSSTPNPRIAHTPYYYFYIGSGVTQDLPDGNRETLKFLSDRDRSFGVWTSPPRTLKDNRWYYVVATYDSSDLANRPALYINGVEQPAWLQQAPSGNQFTSPHSSYIGNSKDSDRLFSGQIGGVRIYNRQLSPAEIAQLGAVMAERKWGRYSLIVDDPETPGAASECRIVDANGVSVDGDYQWQVDSGGGYTIDDPTSVSPRIHFLGEARYRISAIVSDGVTARRFSAEVPQFQAGSYTGTTGSGGIVWMQVSADRTTALLTIMDPESGYMRLEESVRIDALGNFESETSGAERVSGKIGVSLTGAIDGLQVTFSATLVAPGDPASPFEGVFRGGVVDEANDLVTLGVFGDGSWILGREGVNSDMATGSLDESGAFAAVSLGGVAVSGGVDAAGERVVGSIAMGGDSSEFYLERAGIESPLGLAGGLVVAPAPVAPGETPFVRFVARGDVSTSVFVDGSLSLATDPGLASRDLLLLGSAGSTVIPGGDDTPSALAIAGVLFGEGVGDLGWNPLAAISASVRVVSPSQSAVAFRLEGSVPQRILARSLGPTFGQGTLGDPHLRLYRWENGGLSQIAFNEDWDDAGAFSASGLPRGAAKSLADAIELLGLSPLEAEAKDSAALIWLAPGDYLLVGESDSGDSAGEGLLEVWELP